MIESALYVVATPIGNLGDMTFRGVEVLKASQFILAEDSRTTSKLLNHYGIKAPVISYRDQNHDRMIDKIIEKLKMGLTLSLVSDAGTPLLSDPGFRLINHLQLAGYKVVSVPGPSSLAAAISIAGVPTDQIHFYGFLQKSEKKVRDFFGTLTDVEYTAIYFDSPQRLVKDLLLLQDVLGAQRIVSVCKDISKLYERVYLGAVSDILKTLNEQPSIKGEYVVLVAKSDFTLDMHLRVDTK